MVFLSLSPSLSPWKAAKGGSALSSSAALEEIGEFASRRATPRPEVPSREQLFFSNIVRDHYHSKFK